MDSETEAKILEAEKHLKQAAEVIQSALQAGSEKIRTAYLARASLLTNRANELLDEAYDEMTEEEES